MRTPQFEIRGAVRDEMPQAVSSVVAAFITDPVARFAWPAPHDYLASMPMTTQEFAGGQLHTQCCADLGRLLCRSALVPARHPSRRGRVEEGVP
jgi:hypothetical protein